MLETQSQELLDDPKWPAEYVVRHRKAVETLLDIKAIRMLGPFLHGTRTLSQAAGELEVSTSTMAYWIRKLEAVGLLVRLEPERRGGMAMPRYRAAASRLFLPFASVPPGLDSDLLDGGRKRILDRFLDGLDEALAAGHSGLVFAPSGPVGVEIDVRDPPSPANAQPWTDFWGWLSLTREQATDFANDLKALLTEYRELEGGTGEYVVHIGVAPAPRRKRRSV